MLTLWGSTMSIGPVREMHLTMRCPDELIQVCCASISSLWSTELSLWLLLPHRPSRRRLICLLLSGGLRRARICAKLMCANACACAVASARSSVDSVFCTARRALARVLTSAPGSGRHQQQNIDYGKFTFCSGKRNRITLLIDTQLPVLQGCSVGAFRCCRDEINSTAVPLDFIRVLLVDFYMCHFKSN